MSNGSEIRTRPALTGETLTFMQQLWKLAHALDVRSKRMARILGVTGPQRLAIRVIGQSPGSGANEIAAILNIHPSTLSGILARLEGHGLIARGADPDDRRRARFTLTSKGVQIDRMRRSTVEGAVARALARADSKLIARTSATLGILVAELLREDAT